jgi:hypothetical protein
VGWISRPVVANRKLEFGPVGARSLLRQNHPGESTIRTMKTHPDHGQDVPMATTLDHLADSVTPIITRRIVLRAFVLLASWAIGLLVAAWIVPRISLSVPGFIVAVLAFAVTQAILSSSISKLPHRYASLLLGGTGLASTIMALTLASVLTHGLTIDGMPSWLAITVVVWLVTTIGAITLPELFIGAGPARPIPIPACTNGCTSVIHVETRHAARLLARNECHMSKDDGGSSDGRHA